MFFVFLYLFYNFKKYHHFEAKIAQKSMVCFVLFEILIQLPYILEEFAHSHHDENMRISFHIMAIGGYLVLQSFSIISLKPSKDPLESISNLDYLQLLSINQRINDDFLQNIFADTQWKSLTTEQKNEFKEAFLSKSF